MNETKKPIAVTMGEPSGISSEIIIKTWLQRRKRKIYPFILIDDMKKLNEVNYFFNLNANFHSITTGQDIFKIFEKSIPVLDIKANISFRPGLPDKVNSKFVLKSINMAVDLFFENKVSSLITLPICKRTLKLSKFNYNGHTEYLSYLTKEIKGKKESEIMILSTTKPIDKGKNLIVGLVTTHIPLKKIHKTITIEKTFNKIFSFKNSLVKIWGIKSPKIGITSINPHAGEGGLIGDEEIKILNPVLDKCKQLNLKIIGPISSDSCFHRSNREKFDGIVCFYHDQGLIPVKTLDFHNSINVTGGLPFIRVSPDHGPAFDIAKKNIANLNSIFACFDFLKKKI